jgi:hypothetical protein
LLALFFVSAVGLWVFTQLPGGTTLSPIREITHLHLAQELDALE